MANPSVEALARTAQGEWRAANADVQGTVHQVDPTKQKVRLRLGGSDEEPFLSPWVSYGQTAGAMKFHNPPSVGQQMKLSSPGGDWMQGYATPTTFSDENASPSDKGDEHVLTIGSLRAVVKGDSLVVTIGGSSFRMTGSEIEQIASKIALQGDEVPITGSTLTHNGHSVGDDHVHSGVTPGGSMTGPPP